VLGKRRDLFRVGPGWEGEEVFRADTGRKKEGMAPKKKRGKKRALCEVQKEAELRPAAERRKGKSPGIHRRKIVKKKEKSFSN